MTPSLFHEGKEAVIVVPEQEEASLSLVTISRKEQKCGKEKKKPEKTKKVSDGNRRN